MSLDPCLSGLLTETISVAPVTGKDLYGNKSYGPAASFRARINRVNKLVRTHTGEQEVASHEIWVDGVGVVGPTDRVTLPDSTSPNLLSVESYSDENGPLFDKIFMGGGGTR